MSSSVGVDAADTSLASAPEPTPGRGKAEVPSSSSELDRRHLQRMLRAERLFPVFMRANLAIAAALALYYSWSGSWSGVRAVLVLLILLGARAHLRQLRSARLLRKLSGSGAASW